MARGAAFGRRLASASHGRQIDTNDKKRMGDQLYRAGTRDSAELADLLSLTASTLEIYLRDAKHDEKKEQKATRGISGSIA